MQKIIVNSPQETIKFAQMLGAKLTSGTILTLEGDLAAGKTTFTKGLALGLGIDEIIDSPTFAIVKEYDGKIPLFHLDVYRLTGDFDAEFIQEYFNRDGVCVIEWASMIVADLPAERIDVKISRLSENSREITIVANKEVFDCANLSD